MRNKGEFSWIIFLSLMEYALSDDTCERNTCIGPISYGKFLPRSAFTTKYHLSLYQCATECQLRRQRCKSFNYRRSFVSCQLCEEDSGPGGMHLQPKAGSDHSNIDTWKNIPVGKCNEINCSWTEKCDSSKADAQSACVKTECPFAVLKPGVTIEPSNETAVRTKARYRCVSHDMERGSPLTTCQESSAEWSPTYFKCVCTSPPAKSGAINETAEVEVGQNYTYRCQDGLFGKRDQNPTVMCLKDGTWTSTNFTCVCTSPPAKSGAINETAEVEVGQNYTYRCQDGLFGKRDQNPTVMCLKDGTWTSTNFTCVCTSPPAKSGAINETAEVEVGQNYTYRCQDGLFGKRDQNPTVMCLKDGTWTSTNFTCAPSTACPMGYHNVILGGSYFCIKYHTEDKTYHQAMKICESENATLLVVTTQSQIADLQKFVGPGSFWGIYKDWTFIGVSDETNEGYWVTWDGQAVSLFWNRGEPNGSTNENCGAIASWISGINDISCDRSFNFLCHKHYL